MIASSPSEREMTQAFLASDGTYDGLFFTAVRTTGIFCKPSCPARKPFVSNVEFFATVGAAMFAGYRPCKRCQPLASADANPDWVDRLISLVDRDSETRITAAALRELGIDPARARRYFLARYGITFVAFARARRLSRGLTRIRTGGTIDDAVFDSGFESHSGFRDAFARTFGATPGKANHAQSVAATWLETPFGPMVAAASERGLCLLEYTDRRMLEAQLETVRKRLHCALVPGDNAHLEQIRAELAEYFAGTRRQFTVATDAPGTPFQERVWRALCDIPFGETCSYEALARAIGNAAAIRAVGRANGTNRIAIVIPCHRVIGKSGEPVGYGGGLWRKRWLLEHEKMGLRSDRNAVIDGTAAGR